MHLVVDVGNTSTVLGLYQENKLRRTWRVPSIPQSVLRLARKLPRELDSMTISSVVPRINSVLRVLAKRCHIPKVTFVNSRIPLPIRIKVPRPKKVGVDRIVNAVAAYVYCSGRVTRETVSGSSACRRDKTGSTRQDPAKCHSILIIDFGTATTFDLVTSRGDFIGGAIAPGLKTVSEALSSRCTQLPRIPLKKPGRAIGRTTIEAMQSGVFLGYVAMVEGMIEKFLKELGATPFVIATGGLAPLLAKHVRGITRVNQHLTLEGLRIIAQQALS